MKRQNSILCLSMLAACFSTAAIAQVGAPFIHDPSTIVECDGKYYTYGTGGGGLISEDGWTWNSGAQRPGGGAAPDAMFLDGRYLVAYSATGGGLGGGHAGRILTMWNKTMDPSSPDFAYTEAIEVAHSEIDEDCDAIDAGLFLDPTTGRLWCCYGTYFGFIRIVELDRATGARKKGNKEVNIAVDCEATDIIYHNGWYYLLGTHGTCCDGANSTYNIVVGRSKSVTGPYVDNMGRDMIKGGGKMVIAAHNGVTGPGHFGRVIVDEGCEIMSCHFEADFNQGGRSVLGIRPLLWKNDWPVAGEKFQEGTYEIESERRGYALELAVDFVRMNGGMRGFFGRGQAQTMEPLKEQSLEEVIGTWPEGNIPARIGDYMFRPHQKWTVTAAPDGSGYLGGPYYKIVIEGTERALAAAENYQVITVPEFTGAPEQLWKIEQLIDGTFRISPKSAPGVPEGEQVILISAGDSTPALGAYDFNSDNSKWNFKKH